MNKLYKFRNTKTLGTINFNFYIVKLNILITEFCVTFYIELEFQNAFHNKAAVPTTILCLCLNFLNRLS